MRITVLPLILQSDESPAHHLSSSITGSIDLKASTSLPTPDSPPAYISLLSDPFVPPPALFRPNGLPSNPVLAASSPNTPLVLTPDTMRYFGSTVERVMGQIREILLASRATDMRVQLQMNEFARQQAKTRELLAGIDKLKTEKQQETTAKLESVRDGQRTLMARVDRILGAMMINASPEVSEHERRWFAELERMRDEVVGRGRYDQDSLATRTNLVGALIFICIDLLLILLQLRRELDRLLPSLKDLGQKEEKLRKKMLADGITGLGVTQAFQFGERASSEYVVFPFFLRSD